MTYYTWKKTKKNEEDYDEKRKNLTGEPSKRNSAKK